MPAFLFNAGIFFYKFSILNQPIILKLKLLFIISRGKEL